MAQLRDIIAAVSGLAGFDTSEVDTAAIPNTDVRGYIIDRPQSAREVLAVLRALYRFDVQDTARLHFVGRGRDGDTPFSLTEDTDTLASAQRVRTQETELPRIATLSYLDADRQLEFGNAVAQRSLVHRGLGAISSRQRFDLRAYIVLTPDQARGMAERMLYAYWRERDRMTLNLPPRYLAISPGDFVSFLDRRSRRMLGRVERQDIGADLTTELEVTVVESAVESPLIDSTDRFVLDARTGEGLPDIDAPEPTPLIAPGRRTDIDGRLRMVSVSALADADVDVYGRTVRPYATLERYEEASWDNASIRVSQTRTGSQRTAIRGALASQIIGRLIVPPSDNWTPDFIDRDGRMTVRVIDETARIRLRALRPTNETEFVSGRSRLIVLRRDGEAAVLAYRFLEQSDGDNQVLVLSRLIRGLHGTEHLDRDYTGGETVVFLIPGERPAYVAINKAFRNRQLFFQAHLEATPLGVIPHTVIPAALRPYSPAHLMVEGAAGDVTATWVRRTRMGGEDDLLDGIEDVPNVEPTERYNVDVLAADGTLIHHVADVRSTEYSYPLTQRQADEAGLEVEYRFEIGLEDGRGGRQDVAETILSASRFSGNILTMVRAGELLGVDWWASSGTQRTVRHAVFLMNAGTLLDVDSVLVEPSEPVSFDGRTGENFVSHDYAEPVPFAAGDNVLVAVEGAINVVPAGAMRDPRIRPPFNFAVELDVATDDGVATTLGRGMFTMRLRYRMVISEHDARTVRVAQVGWAGPGTPAETAFTPDPLREPNRVKIAFRILTPDILGPARATPLRFGMRFGTDRGERRPTRATGQQPWVLTGQVQSVRTRLAMDLTPRREVFPSGANPFGPLGDPAITDAWRLIGHGTLQGVPITDIYELRARIIKSIVEPASTLKIALRLQQPDIAAGNVRPPRLTQRVRLRSVGKRQVYEATYWMSGRIEDDPNDAGFGAGIFNGDLAFTVESQPSLDMDGRIIVDAHPVNGPTGVVPSGPRGPGNTDIPLPSNWTGGRRLWLTEFSMRGYQQRDLEEFIPPADPINDPFGGTRIPWGHRGNQGAGTFDFDLWDWPSGFETIGSPLFTPITREHELPIDVQRSLEFSIDVDGKTMRWERHENYGLPTLRASSGGRFAGWVIPPSFVADVANAIRARVAQGDTYARVTLRIEGPRSGALRLGVRLNPPVYVRTTPTRGAPTLKLPLRLRQPSVVTGRVRATALRIGARLNPPAYQPPRNALQIALNLRKPRYRIPGRRVSTRAADLGDSFFTRYSVGNSGLTYEVPPSPFSANPDNLPKLPSHWMLNQFRGAALVYFRARNRFGTPSVDMIFSGRVDGFPVAQQLDPAHNASFYGSIKSTPVIEDKTADYTITAGDLGKTIRLTGDTARTFTFPTINLDGDVDVQWWVRIANAATARLFLSAGTGQTIRGGDITMPAGSVWIVQVHSDARFNIPYEVSDTGAAQLSTNPVELSWRPSDLESNTASRITYVFSDDAEINKFLDHASADATITLIGPEAT